MESLAVDRLALRDRHRAVRPAVVPALHVDDVLSARDRARHLDRCLDRLRARVPEEERVQRRVGHHRDKLLDALQVGLVVGNAALWG